MSAFLLASRRIEPDQSRYLDMWRGGSAIVVLLGHAAPLYFAGETVFPAFAGAAVMAFFGLSGFFIHKSLANASQTGAMDWRSYGAARVNRILPTFVFALIVTCACWAVAPAVFQSGTRDFLTPTTRESISLGGIVQTAFFLNGFLGPTVSANGPLWSLACEVWLYVGPGSSSLATGREWAWAGLAAFLIFVTLNPIFEMFAACWVGGAIGFMLHANGKLDWATPRQSYALLALPAVGLASVVLSSRELPYDETLRFQKLFGMWFLVHLAQTLNSERLPSWPRLASSAAFPTRSMSSISRSCCRSTG